MWTFTHTQQYRKCWIALPSKAIHIYQSFTHPHLQQHKTMPNVFHNSMDKYLRDYRHPFASHLYSFLWLCFGCFFQSFIIKSFCLICACFLSGLDYRVYYAYFHGHFSFTPYTLHTHTRIHTYINNIPIILI